MGRPKITPQDVVDRIIVQGDECWLLPYQAHKSGYVRVGRTCTAAHRIVYEYFRGAIPAGLILDHLCRNRACCNPDHLEPVTQKENLNRGIHRNSVKTHCPKGHPYEGANLFYDAGKRKCRECVNAKGRAASKKRHANGPRGPYSSHSFPPEAHKDPL